MPPTDDYWPNSAEIAAGAEQAAAPALAPPLGMLHARVGFLTCRWVVSCQSVVRRADGT